MDRFSRQKISNDRVDLTRSISQIDLIDIYRILHPTAEYTFFSSTHGTFSSRDHMLGHKASLNKFKNVEIMSIFSVHSGIKLEVNSRRKMGKVTHMWKLTHPWT